MSDKLTGEALEQALTDRNLPSTGTADEKRDALTAYDTAQSPQSGDLPDKTRLDSDVTKPSTTAPGDGPADTTDPTERATSVTPNPGDGALAVGTVNAVKPLPKAVPAATSSKRKPRIETYETVDPAGKKVKVELNLETGESKRL